MKNFINSFVQILKMLKNLLRKSYLYILYVKNESRLLSLRVNIDSVLRWEVLTNKFRWISRPAEKKPAFSLKSVLKRYYEQHCKLRLEELYILWPMAPKLVAHLNSTSHPGFHSAHTLLSGMLNCRWVITCMHVSWLQVTNLTISHKCIFFI